jgi:hypothetical protein
MVDEGVDAFEALLARPAVYAAIRLGILAYAAAAAIAAAFRRLAPPPSRRGFGLIRTAVTVAAALFPDLAERIGAALKAALDRAGAAARAAAGASEPQRLRAAWEAVRQEVEPIEERLRRARAMVTVGRLESGLGEDGEIWVDMVPAAAVPPAGEAARLSCRLDYLSGDPGEPGLPLLSTYPDSFPERLPLSRFAGQDFRLNVAATMTLRGLRFLDPGLDRRLRRTAGRLAGRSYGEKAVGAYLERRLAYFERLEREGLEGERIHAASREPVYMTIGRSRLGFTSRVGGTE